MVKCGFVEYYFLIFLFFKQKSTTVNPLTPELNRSAQRCLTRFFTGDFAS
jgi:hypothetical protein